MYSWSEFVSKAALLFDSGASNSAISKEFEGKEFEWNGKVRKIEIEQEYAPGVEIDMPEVNCALQNGKHIKANYLFLNVSPETKSSWLKIKVGEFVKFKTIIATNSGPFPAIELSTDNNDPEVLLLIGTKQSKAV